MSDIPVFREIAGDSANYFAPGDPQALAMALGAMCSDAIRGPASSLRGELLSWSAATQVLLSELIGARSK